MSKRRSGSTRRKMQNKVDWNKDKFKSLGRQFQYGENLLHKDAIVKIVGQAGYNNLVKGGYLESIKNADKGYFKANEKFRNEFKLKVDADARWTGSGSVKHSAGINNFLKMVPEKVMTEGRIKNELELKEEFKKIKSTEQYKTALKDEKEKLKIQLEQLEKDYKAKITNEANYLIDKRNINNDLKILNDTRRGVSAPDMRVILTKNEAEETLNNLRNEMLHVPKQMQAEYERSLVKMERIISTSTSHTVELNIEITTENYEYKELKAKENYETLTENEVIYLPSY